MNEENEIEINWKSFFPFVFQIKHAQQNAISTFV